ncbi:MAG: hypothetical protein CL398_11800 [Acidiferrobacteraceae bacterium]|nr:hypothetical protein [Acidiferrobacteraceae bacterium]|tara:strand:- start:2134 stop:2946 length:813 start_codon:yes stop_codon:yes gene_type:complete
MRIITALRFEAMPIIEHYKLNNESSASRFPLYRNDSIFLTISGVGKENSSAATANIHAVSGELPQQPFLNIGIAGHRRPPTGMAWIASSIQDESTCRRWYPPQIICNSMARTSVITVNQPEQEYRHDTAYDMEAAGFYPIANQASTSELVQVLKVTSDHPGKPASSLNAKKISALIQINMNNIEELITSLQKLADTLNIKGAEPIHMQHFLDRWHFTVTQRFQLQKVLARWAILSPTKNPYLLLPPGRSNATAVIKTLEIMLRESPLNLH